jgi:hypothetical protein
MKMFSTGAAAHWHAVMMAMAAAEAIIATQADY